MRRGFTLIEMLVVVGIIGVLMSIVLPALGGARVSSRRVLSLTNTKSIAETFITHESETGAWPTKEVLEGGGGFWTQTPSVLLDHTRTRDGETMEVRFFLPIWELAALWPFLLSEQVVVEEHMGTWFSPGRPVAAPTVDPETMADGLVPPVSYRYSNSFLASGRLWGEAGETGDASVRTLVTEVRGSDVAHPSAKALLWDADLAYLDRAPPVRNGHFDEVAPMAFADGHSDLKNPADAREGVPNPLNNGSSIRLHNTPGGVRGTDY